MKNLNKPRLPKQRPIRAKKKATAVERLKHPIDREERAVQKVKVASEAMFQAMGAHAGVLALLEGAPDDDVKAAALRNMLMDPTISGTDKLGRPLMSFAKMRQRAGYSAQDMFALFNDVQHATALVVASASKPRLVAELVDSASARRVACDLCGATKRIAETDDDGEFLRWRHCAACDEDGLVVVDGSVKSRELYFNQFGFRTDASMVTINNTSQTDARSVTFVAGGPGTAVSALSLIRALDRVKDVGAGAAGPKQVTGIVVEGETV